MNGKQLKGKVIRIFKRKSDSPHCMAQQKNIIEARRQNVEQAETCYALIKLHQKSINSSKH
jgi:hypothetical protein